MLGGGYGGDFVVADQSYREIASVRAGHGEHGDLHEFLLTSRGTALITIYSDVPADLTSVGGRRTASSPKASSRRSTCRPGRC